MTTTTTRGRTAPKGSVNLNDLRYSVTQTRANFTRVRGVKRGGRLSREPKADFITFVSLACEMYRDHGDDLVPIQQYSPELETYQGKGHTSLVTYFQVSQLTPSNYLRGATSTYSEPIVIKRPRNSILEEKSYGLTSFITELRVRNHAPLRTNPHIAKLRGIGWDFEDQEATIPRPILLEELAAQGAMDNLWKNWDFVRMTFKSRLEFCRDIADGLHALHLCGVVHGDVKPENILVFPREDKRDAFMVKLTDFGHSVLEHDNLEALPAFTPLWCAPEATQKASMTFQDMVATDCYSYGLVILSIMIGRAFHTAFENVEDIKSDGSILERSVALIEREDKESNDSDLEVDVVKSLLRKTLRLDPKARSLRHCMAIIDRYEKRNSLAPAHRKQRLSDKKTPLPHLDVAGKVDIGYQTLMRCSHQFKTYIVDKLLLIANDTADRRRAAAAWELTVCYFSGFGVPRSFEESSRWLAIAASNGSVAAQDYFNNLHAAMGIDPRSIARSAGDVNSAWSSTTATDWEPSRILAPTQDLQAAAIVEESGNSDRESYVSESEDALAEQITPTSMPSRVASLVASGSVDELRGLLQEDATLINSQDSAGDTPLLLAVKSRRCDVVELVLEYPEADAGICNRAGQSVLHHLPRFSDEEIKHLVPRLIERKADPNVEYFSTPQDGGSAGLASGIRSCAILNSILHKNLTLLRSVLEAGHSDQCVSACRVCEAGSAFRRMLAVSLSFFQADALEILVAHVRAHKGDEVLELDKIEVWAGQELLPLHKVPFHSVAVASMDLPESFFRALFYGVDHLNSLRRTMDFLITAGEDVAAVSYSMLDAAVNKNSIDAVGILLEDGPTRRLPIPWGIEQQNIKIFADSYQLPIMAAIRSGFREVFDIFLQDDTCPFKSEYCRTCSLPECRLSLPRWKRALYLIFGLSTRSRPARRPQVHTHAFNLVRPALEAVILDSTHQDVYFLNTLLSIINPDLVAKEWAPSLLGRAVLKSSFKGAARLAECFPSLWTNTTDIWVGSRVPPELNDRTPEDHFKIREGTVVEWVLYDGSYEQCKFVLNALRSARQASQPTHWAAARRLFRRQRRRKQDTADDMFSQRQQVFLADKEYHALLSGNIRRARDDREPLWSVIAQEIDNGHSTSQLYLVVAIKYYNVEALRKMLDIGWKANPKLLLTSPLQLVNTMMEDAKADEHHELAVTQALFDMLQRDSGPFLTGGSGDASHSTVYSRYWETQQELIGHFRLTKLQEMADILVGHGARESRIVVPNSSSLTGLAAGVAIVVYALFYIFVPLVLVYTTEDVWTSMSRSQKFGFAYLWAAVSLFFPPLGMVLEGPPHRIDSFGVSIWYLAGAACFVVNHIVLPVLVIQKNWKPLLFCKQVGSGTECRVGCQNYTFLLPLVAGGVEYVFGASLYQFGDMIDLW